MRIKYRLRTFVGTDEIAGYVAFMKFGYAFGVHREPEGWVVSELSTGRKIGSPLWSREQAVRMAKHKLEHRGKHATRLTIDPYEVVNPEWEPKKRVQSNIGDKGIRGSYTPEKNKLPPPPPRQNKTLKETNEKL